MRIPLIAGNWKMNNTVSNSSVLAEELIKFMKDYKKEREVLICCPSTSLYALSKITHNSNVKLGAQNMHYEEKGAFTGEISPLMIKDIGVEYIIIGHSERRQLFGESDELINKKITSAIKHDLKPILCVGETLEQREANIEKNIIKSQISKGLKDIEVNDITNIVIAYEPIWAIGTGRTATSEQANDMVSYIRDIIKELYDENTSNNIRILYGGSVKPGNASDIMAQSDIDGALVGGASLKADDFKQIIDF